MLFNLKKNLNILKPLNFFFVDKFPNDLFKRKKKGLEYKKEFKDLCIEHIKFLVLIV
jgi:hypothetical protein